MYAKKHNLHVDEYFQRGCGRCDLYDTPACKVHAFQEVLIALRILILQTPLTEERKWSCPCYTFQGRNVLILSALKPYCVVGFFKGALLQDTANLLVTSGPHSQSSRQLRFRTLRDVKAIQTSFLAYIHEAIDIERKGLVVPFTEKDTFTPAQELQEAFLRRPDVKRAFDALSPGRRRSHHLYITSAKTAKTRAVRIERCIPKILNKEGWNEAYTRSKPKT